MSETDKAATRERRFKDPKSRVMRDGREILKGQDWKDRKQELWYRAGGQCEYITTMSEVLGSPPSEDRWNLRCSETSGDPCHDPNPRHPLRDDRLSNLKFFCRPHHILTDKVTEKRKLRFGEKA